MQQAHKHCECHEASLVAAKKFYRSCTQLFIAISTLIASDHSDNPIVVMVIGFTIMLMVVMTGKTVEHRAYVLAHDRENLSSH